MPRFPKTLALLAALATTAAAGLAAAEPGHHGPRKGELMKKYDANGDGKLDEHERQALRAERKSFREQHRKEMITRYDRNRDGKLDDAERKVLIDEKTAARFARIDTDRNGQISLAEFQAAAASKGFFRHHRGPGKGH
jgi:Ca2+-binding EF-hand superfamily protein